MKHVREFSVNKQNAIINYGFEFISLCVILYGTKMTFYRASFNCASSMQITLKCTKSAFAMSNLFKTNEHYITDRKRQQ